METLAVLNGIPAEERNAEWYYVYGCVQVRLGNFIEGGRAFDRACAMDPYNNRYSEARDALRSRGVHYDRTADSNDCNTGCGGDCCTECCRVMRCYPCFCCC
ncbi:MAG: hypothetical protein MJ137_03980 [Clostridia bacterium]|nr:hypothetical protein [Clostridia bacterium]